MNKCQFATQSNFYFSIVSLEWNLIPESILNMVVEHFVFSSFKTFIPRNPLSPCQTESQVDASSQLASTCDSIWSGLACVHLR